MAYKWTCKEVSLVEIQHASSVSSLEHTLEHLERKNWEIFTVLCVKGNGSRGDRAIVVARRSVNA